MDVLCLHREFVQSLSEPGSRILVEHTGLCPAGGRALAAEKLLQPHPLPRPPDRGLSLSGLGLQARPLELHIGSLQCFSFSNSIPETISFQIHDIRTRHTEPAPLAGLTRSTAWMLGCTFLYKTCASVDHAAQTQLGKALLGRFPTLGDFSVSFSFSKCTSQNKNIHK